MSSKNFKKKKTSKALGRNNLLSTATRNMKFHKTFLVMIEVHVCREGFVFVTNKYISTATVTHVKRHYSETDWKMSKLRLCQLKLGFFNHSFLHSTKVKTISTKSFITLWCKKNHSRKKILFLYFCCILLTKCITPAIFWKIAKCSEI